MKLVALAMSVACVPIFSQDTTQDKQMRQLREALGNLQRLASQKSQDEQITTAINEHRSFQLPNNFLGTSVLAKASGIKDEGGTLTLTGVEITTGSVAVTADELIFVWGTQETELHGNVRLKPATAQ